MASNESTERERLRFGRLGKQVSEIEAMPEATWAERARKNAMRRYIDREAMDCLEHWERELVKAEREESLKMQNPAG